MTWVAWRTQRAQLEAAIAVALLLVAFLVATGLSMGHSPTWKYWGDGTSYVLLALPAVLGLGIGCPLVAGELDRRTQRLAWTQGVSRERWLGYKLAVGAAVVAAASAVFAIVSGWWVAEIAVPVLSNSGGITGLRITPATFDVTGIVLVGYSLFAFGLGVALGALLRRPGWAFAAGVPLFVAARLFVRSDVRAHLASPDVATSLTGIVATRLQHSWILDAGIVPAGRTSPLPGQSWNWYPRRLEACQNAVTKSETGWTHCFVQAHVHYAFVFQPESHYWPLQGAETALFVAAAAVLLAVGAFVVHRIAA